LSPFQGRSPFYGPVPSDSKEVLADNDDMKWWWKIFYAAKENWTVPSENWEAVDWGLFTGNAEATKILAKRKIDFMMK
jgi:dimethylglycine catabolism B